MHHPSRIRDQVKSDLRYLKKSLFPCQLLQLNTGHQRHVEQHLQAAQLCHQPSCQLYRAVHQ